MNCAACGYDNDPDDKFCSECGEPLRARCDNCEAELKPAARFCSRCGTPTTSPERSPKVKPAPQTPDIVPLPGARPEGERRQLTVMFCDIVGSTELSGQLDPEELQRIVRSYQQISAQIIERYEGHVAQYLGDGLLVYFGYPQAHEDDAERAVRAGLGIVAALQDAKAVLSRPIAVRVGLHTGQVVVGEMGRGEQLALGETPNIAARVQGLTRPNTVVMSGATAQLVAGLFVCDPLGPQQLKGVATPVPVYRVVGESAAHGRFEAASQSGLTPLVGRDEEAGLLQRHWAQVSEGRGQVVLLSGEAGIGKSRLVQDLKEHVLQDAAARIEFRCSPYYQNTALYPVVDCLERLLAFLPHDTATIRLEKLERLLSRFEFTQDDTRQLLASLLSLPLPDGCAPLNLSPERHKQRTNETLVAWILEEARRQPVYCAWEDMHWADPSTLELLELFLDHVPTARLLALLTFRPEFRPPWELRAHFSRITLIRLGRAQIEQMVARLTAGRALPTEVMQQIVTKTDGVPLFIEELTKMVLESGLVRAENGRYALSGPLPPLAIPSTLQDSLMARLDRLASARELAQLGATLGREFSYDLIRAVSSLDEALLHRGLEQLVEAELVYRKGLPPQASYLFKHALVQDAAYQSTLKSQRQHFHQRIALVLEAHFPEIVTSQPELLAHHHTEAGLAAQAIPYWQLAGERAARRSANLEAHAHLTMGLALLRELPQDGERIRQEIDVQITLGAVMLALKGYGSAEAGEAYARARELCQLSGNIPDLFLAVFGLWQFHMVRAQYETTQELAQQLLQLAENRGDHLLLIQAQYAVGLTHLVLGRTNAARRHFAQGTTLYDPQLHSQHAFLYGQDGGVANLIWEAAAQWCAGYPERARSLSSKALDLARDLRHPYTTVYALYCASILDQCRGDTERVNARADAAIELCVESGFMFLHTMVLPFRGWALAAQGHAEGITEIRQGLDATKAAWLKLWRPYYLGVLASACERLGKPDDGLAALTEALAISQITGERFFEAELHRLHGELTLQANGGWSAPKAAAAEACFRQALDVAAQQEAKSWELRAATSLARLWQQQDKPAEARRLLASVYDWFTEGFDTPDLQQAKALLDDLA